MNESANDGMIKQLRVLGGNDNIFSDGSRYVIPLYQRDYAWERKEIERLIKDISAVEGDNDYCIGSLVVSRKESGEYEVVDGQQRLTTLFLLLKYLGHEEDIKGMPLSFECREKSDYTLINIDTLAGLVRSKTAGTDQLDPEQREKIQKSIWKGLIAIKDSLRETEDLEADIKRNKGDGPNGPSEKSTWEKRIITHLRIQLEKVIVYRIVLPEHTDLLRYFEIMNIRGEQLEKHEILKATLMGYLNKSDNPKNEKRIFSAIWEACSDMSGYVWQHLDIDAKETLWSCLKKEKDMDELESFWDSLTADAKGYDGKTENVSDEKRELADGGEAVARKGANEAAKTILDIIEEYQFGKETNAKEEGREPKGKEEGKEEECQSIIEFPYFLLHSLKVYQDNYCSKEEKDRIKLPQMTDAKKLLEDFALIIEKKDEKAKTEFSEKFIRCLFKTRCLFDHYIIKTKINNEDNGEENDNWVLECLEGDGTEIKKCLMIQSALRVSYTTPEGMRWITDLLLNLFKKVYEEENFDEKIFVEDGNFAKEIEGIAKTKVNEAFFSRYREECINLKGTNTPNIVFNYLDYILWRDGTEGYLGYIEKTFPGENFPKIDRESYKFKFRNSVEHWYPQHPSQETFPKWTGIAQIDGREYNGVDRFGNLCLLPRDDNSKFSNNPPIAKSGFAEKIAGGSIKLQIMNLLTLKLGNSIPDSKFLDEWQKTCINHEKVMLCLLAKECLIPEMGENCTFDTCVLKMCGRCPVKEILAKTMEGQANIDLNQKISSNIYP